MKSYSGAESLPFASDHVAWRETASDPYCEQEAFDESSLRWTDALTANTVQFWRIAPAGFGIFFDVRSGQQLVIIGKSEDLTDGGEYLFTHWDRYLREFDQQDSSFCPIEAVRLEPGNRL